MLDIVPKKNAHIFSRLEENGIFHKLSRIKDGLLLENGLFSLSFISISITLGGKLK